MMNKAQIFLFTFVALLNIGYSNAQVQSADCGLSENICGDNGTSFPLSIGNGIIDDLPVGTNISNPGNGAGPNNGNPNTAGCLNSGELNPNWFIINVGASGFLEFTIGGPGGTGFYDWALWPYYENANGTTACDDITNNILPPVACNWNQSSAGFTGMTQQGFLPAGAVQGNFEYGIPVVAGDAFVLSFSNWSGGSGLTQLTFGGDITGNPNAPQSAAITCTPNTPDQTICLGGNVTLDIMLPTVLVNPTYLWLVTNGVSDVNSGVGVVLTPTVTTEYIVQISDVNLGTPALDTFTVFVEMPQTPYAGVDQFLCVGDPILMNAVLSDVNNTSLWQYSATGIVPTPVVTFAPNFSDPMVTVTVDQVGAYMFFFRETSEYCGDVYDTMEVIVSDLDIAAVSVNPSCIGFADGEIHITSQDAVEYSFDGGTTWQVDSFAIIFNSGNYVVCARTALGCLKCVQVGVIDPPSVTISVSSDTLICENGTGSLWASATGGVSYLFNWDFTSNTDSNQMVNPSINTIYTVFAENENGCVSNPASISVTLLPPISGSVTSFDTVCPTFSTEVIASAGGGIGEPYTFVWSTGDIYSGVNLDSITVTPNQTTNYTVTITDECESSPLILQTNVRVSPLPVPLYTILDPIQCEAAEFTIVNSTDPSLSNFVTWVIDDDIEFVNQDTILTQELWAGNHDIQMTVTSFEGCLDSMIFYDALFVVSVPTANFGFTPNPITMFNTTVQFLNYSIDGFSYEWFFEGALPSSSLLEDVTVQYPDGELGTYEVMLITTSELGCIDTLIRDVTIYSEVLLFSPNTFTPNNDEHNQSWRVFIEGVDKFDFNLKIYDRWGEVIWESNDPDVAWDGTYKGKTLPDGMYNWVVKVGDLLNDDVHNFNGHVNIIR